MAGERKQFLRHLKQSWAEKFPCLRPIHLKETARLGKDLQYVIDDYAESRGLYYFFSVNFTKVTGEFYLIIAISRSRERSLVELGWPPEPNAHTIGSFPIANFMGKQARYWALLEPSAETSMLHPEHPDDWRPSTYKQPLEKIIAEAIDDINNVIETCVFPKLEIACP